MNKLIGSPLRNTYASINKFKLDFIGDDLNLFPFIKGNDLPKFIKENNSKILDSDIISIIDTNMNNIYWNNRELLSITDLEKLTDTISYYPIEFVRSEDELTNLQVFLLQNNIIIDYNVLYITVRDFIKFINSNKPIVIKLPKMSINIEIQYELYDFYNELTNHIDDFISR